MIPLAIGIQSCLLDIMLSLLQDYSILEWSFSHLAPPSECFQIVFCKNLQCEFLTCTPKTMFFIFWNLFNKNSLYNKNKLVFIFQFINTTPENELNIYQKNFKFEILVKKNIYGKILCI